MAKLDTQKLMQKYLDPKAVRKYLFYAIILIIGYIINPKTLILAIFIIGTVVGKMLRAQIADNMFMFDPLVFFSILLMYHWGFKYLILFLFITVFVADALAGKISSGSLLNYFLFHFCPLVSFFIFGRLGIAVMGNVSAIMYSVLYGYIRINFLAGDPIATTIKAVTNVIFVFLYISFFAPVFALIM